MGWQASHSSPWLVPPLPTKRGSPCRLWQSQLCLPSWHRFRALTWAGKTPASSCTDRWACAETTSSLVLPTWLPSAFLSQEEEHWEESPPPSDPPGCITGKSLAPALGTSAGHFDVVFWLVLGPASLLLCLGLFLRVLPKASETLSSPLKWPSLFLDLRSGDFKQSP